MKYLLPISIIVSIITYSFWIFLPKGSFYIGNGLFIFLVCSYIFSIDKRNVWAFILWGLSINNLADELFFDNTKLEFNEIVVGVAIIIIAIIKIKKNARQRLLC